MCASMNVYMHACLWACIYMSVHTSTCASSCKLFPPPPPPPPLNFFLFLLLSFDGSSTFVKVPCFFPICPFLLQVYLCLKSQAFAQVLHLPPHSPGCLEQDAFPSFSKVRLPHPSFSPIFFTISARIQNLDSFLLLSFFYVILFTGHIIQYVTHTSQ